MVLVAHGQQGGEALARAAPARAKVERYELFTRKGLVRGLGNGFKTLLHQQRVAKHFRGPGHRDKDGGGLGGVWANILRGCCVVEILCTFSKTSLTGHRGISAATAASSNSPRAGCLILGHLQLAGFLPPAAASYPDKLSTKGLSFTHAIFYFPFARFPPNGWR